MKGVFVALLVVASTVQAFYIPGIEPRSHKPGAEIVLNVNSVRSVTQLVPHEYYSLPFCQPQGKNLAFVKEQLGQTLWGDDMTTSPYVVQMQENTGCQPLKCLPSNAKAVRDNIDILAKFIEDDYRGYMSLDNLPGFNNGTRIYGGRCSGTVPQEQMNFFARGYALGVPKWCKGKTMINNFLQFNLKYHRPFPDKDEFRVVGFTIKPYSIALDGPDECGADQTFNPADLQAQKPLFAEDVKSGKRSVVWSYGVTWEEDTKVSWGSRWDSFFATSYADTHMRIHWTFIMYLLLITLFLSVFAWTKLRALNAEIATLNRSDDDGVDETGWKLVHADVFRPTEQAGPPVHGGRHRRAALHDGRDCAAVLGPRISVAGEPWRSPHNDNCLLCSHVRCRRLRLRHNLENRQRQAMECCLGLRHDRPRLRLRRVLLREHSVLGRWWLQRHPRGHDVTAVVPVPRRLRAVACPRRIFRISQSASRAPGDCRAPRARDPSAGLVPPLP